MMGVRVDTAIGVLMSGNIVDTNMQMLFYPSNMVNRIYDMTPGGVLYTNILHY